MMCTPLGNPVYVVCVLGTLPVWTSKLNMCIYRAYIEMNKCSTEDLTSYRCAEYYLFWTLVCSSVSSRFSLRNSATLVQVRFPNVPVIQVIWYAWQYVHCMTFTVVWFPYFEPSYRYPMISCLATLTAMRLPNPQYPFPNTLEQYSCGEQSSCRIYNLGSPGQTCSSVLEQIPIEGAHLIWTVNELETESPTTAKFYLRIYWSQQPCPNLATSQSSWTGRSRTLDSFSTIDYLLWPLWPLWVYRLILQLSDHGNNFGVRGRLWRCGNYSES